MARFSVYERRAGQGYVLDVQADLFRFIHAEMLGAINATPEKYAM
jgi:hypothetical protein